jgi:predicted O-methyltransferase YrrM
MKMSYPELVLTCIDINSHHYVKPCFDKISSDFTNINIILESSHTALKKLQNEQKIYDLIHIDGDHSLEGATKDFENCLKISKKGTIIIFDDTNINYLDNLCNNFIKRGLIVEYTNFNKLSCNVYKHRFLEVL